MGSAFILKGGEIVGGGELVDILKCGKLDGIIGPKAVVKDPGFHC